MCQQGNLLRGVRHLHSNLTKKSKQKKHVEALWLGLLVQLSAYQEGQIVIPKVWQLVVMELNTIFEKFI